MHQTNTRTLSTKKANTCILFHFGKYVLLCPAVVRMAAKNIRHDLPGPDLAGRTKNSTQMFTYYLVYVCTKRAHLLPGGSALCGPHMVGDEVLYPICMFPFQECVKLHTHQIDGLDAHQLPSGASRCICRVRFHLSASLSLYM